MISKEIPRIKALKEKDEIDNYILFTNRKLTGGTHQRIQDRIMGETGVEHVWLVGIETISPMIATRLSEIREVIPELARDQGPLRFYRQEIAAVLDAIKAVVCVDNAEPSPLVFIDLDQKNDLNRLSERYFKSVLTQSTPYFGQIEDFLQEPINRELAETYDSIVVDFNHRVIVDRDDFAKFDSIFQHIYDGLIQGDPALRKVNRLIFALLHYMYWTCDLGEKTDD